MLDNRHYMDRFLDWLERTTPEERLAGEDTSDSWAGPGFVPCPDPEGYGVRRSTEPAS